MTVTVIAKRNTGRIVGYVTEVATPKTDNKTSKIESSNVSKGHNPNPWCITIDD
ncbi:MAG: hypothetical protein V3V18_12820 [Methylococcales bacterium]